MDDFKRVSGVGPALSVLHLHLEVGQQSEANQFLYPSRHNVSVATFFPCRIEFPERISLFDGDGTISGFRKALRAAEANGPYDIVHAHGPIDGFLYLVFCQLRGRRLGKAVYGAHHSYTNINFKRRNRLLSFPCFRYFERLAFVSEASRASFPPRFQRLGKGKSHVVRNGVDLGRLDGSVAGTRVEGPEGSFRVASVGRLIEIKNPMAVLRAFRAIDDPEARLSFVGNGAMEDALGRAAEGDARVRLLGEIPREDVFRFLYSEADLYVSASRGEGMPMAPLEAMASGCPVVLSDIPAHREIAEGTDFIPLVSPDDVSGFAREIEAFRAMSVDERRAVGRRCRKVVEDRFTLQRMHDGYDRVYYDVLGLETFVVGRASEEPTPGPSPATVA